MLALEIVLVSLESLTRELYIELFAKPFEITRLATDNWIEYMKPI